MPRKTIIVVLMFLVLSTIVEAGMPFRRKRGGTGKGEGPFPGSDDVPGLTLLSKILTYNTRTFEQLYGDAGNRYLQYGMENMKSADYQYGDNESDRISLEIALMLSPSAAAGLFHHHRGKLLKGKGRTVDDVGAEAVLDVARGGKNLYFYKGKNFVKVVFTGKGEAPSLLPLAEFVDANLPSGRDDKPKGFDYIGVEGVDESTVAVTSGFTFNLSFLPPSVWASAPGMGSTASDLFIITKYANNDAAELFRDYTAYLKLYAEYLEEYTIGSLKLTKSVDPNQGRVVCAAYKNVFIIACRPDGYEKGEAMIEKVIERVDEVTGARNSGKEEKRGGLFRRRKEE